MASWAQLGFQDAQSPVMEEFVFFHDFAMSIIVLIFVSVGGALSGGLVSPSISKGMLEGQALEMVWTLLPAVVLLQLAAPSLLLLYTLDEAQSSGLSVKAVGHQWYWSYEYSDLWAGGETIEFDSYMKQGEGSARILDTDNRLVVPYGTHVRTMVGSADVLHSWAVPSMGVKADACPGRLNQVKFIGFRPGLAYGQCSEICGANHSFMPIAVELVSGTALLKWLSSCM